VVVVGLLVPNQTRAGVVGGGAAGEGNDCCFGWAGGDAATGGADGDATSAVATALSDTVSA